MTPAQEKIMMEIRDTTIRMEGRMNLQDERIRMNTEDIYKSKEDIGTLKADKNKVIGAMWVFATGFFTMVIGFLVSLFKHN